MSYSPPAGNAIEIDFTVTGYSPPVSNTLVIDFGAVTSQLYADIVESLATGVTLSTAILMSSEIDTVSEVTANLGNKFTEVIYTENFLIIIV